MPATMYPDLPFKRSAPSNAFFWMGLTLIGIFSITVLTSLFPLGLLLPTWQVKVSNVILANAFIAGIGAILIILAQQLDEDSEDLEKWVRRLHVMAIPAAIGFFLLIPLLTYNGYKLLRIASGEEAQQIGQVRKTLDAIRSANNEESLRAAVGQLPGPVPNLGQLTIPLPQAKELISKRVEGVVKGLQNQAEERNANRWQTSLVSWLRNCLLSLCYGAGFAEIAKFPRARKTLLFSLLSSLPRKRRMRSPLGF